MVEFTSIHASPLLEEIFACNILTKEFFPASLIPLAREEYGKILIGIMQFNRGDAEELQVDSEAKQRCRSAWAGFFTFGKYYL